MSTKPSRAEVVDLLALAQDLALGQPLGSQLRAVTLAEARAGAGPAEQATVWCASSLRFLGCTGHAFDMAVVFGDEIEMRPGAAGSTSPTRSRSPGDGELTPARASPGSPGSARCSRSWPAARRPPR